MCYVITAVSFALDATTTEAVWYFQLKLATLLVFAFQAASSCSSVCCCNLIIVLYFEVGSW
jgi:hypothetical protein